MMNRIELRYDKSVTPHTLEVRNDIKGVTNELLMVVFGNSADMLFDLLTNVDYSKLDNYMQYGVYVKEKKGRKKKNETSNN